MKQYKEYMDGIQASDTLHRRLTELEAPAKRPAVKVHTRRTGLLGRLFGRD